VGGKGTGFCGGIVQWTGTAVCTGAGVEIFTVGMGTGVRIVIGGGCGGVGPGETAHGGSVDGGGSGGGDRGVGGGTGSNPCTGEMTTNRAATNTSTVKKIHLFRLMLPPRLFF